MVEGNGEVLDGASRFRDCHRYTAQLVRLILVRNAPLSGLLVDDQQPFVGTGDGEDGVVPCRNICAADPHIRGADKRGCAICARAPDFAIRHERVARTKDLAALGAWARVIDLNALATGELAFCAGWRASRFLVSSHLSESDGCKDKSCERNQNQLLHKFLSSSVRKELYALC